MNVRKVHPSEGVRIRILYKTCEGDVVVRSDIGSASYTVWKTNPLDDSRTAVEGHTNVTIPLSSFAQSVQTDYDTQEEYVLDLTISATLTAPFPQNGSTYDVDILVTDSAGEKHADTLKFLSTTR